MKKLILLILINLHLLTLGDAILWQVDDAMYNADYNAARIIITVDGKGNEYMVAPALFFDEDTWGYNLVYPDGVATVGPPNNAASLPPEWGMSTKDDWPTVDDWEAARVNQYNIIKLTPGAHQSGEMWSLVAQEMIDAADGDKTALRFCIELGNYNYNPDSGECSWVNTVAKSDYVSYQYLEGQWSMVYGSWWKF